MKSLRYYIALAAVAILSACGGDDPVDNPTPTPTPTPTPAAAKIEIPNTENTSPILAQTGGKASLSFTSSGSWTATSSAAWCTVSPTSGNSGNATITITAADNDTYDDRTATVTLKSGNATQTIKVSQVQKDAIVLALSEYTVEAAANTLSFEIQTNVDVTTEVNKDAQSWITQADTRALHAVKLSFDIAANTDTKDRTGTITIKGSDIVQTVTVKQKYDATATERKALMAFYNSTNGSKWTHNDNWGSDKPLDQWYGIYTENGQVTQIELENNNLTGKIPEEIGQLKGLNTIWLGNNHLTGGIPKSIADLPVLENLFLPSNQLTGSIPVEIGNIKTLGSLNLRNNSFSGTIPDNLCNLTNLQHLYLSGGSITGRIPENIGNLKSLRTLNIDDCQLSGTFPESIGQCTNLEDITIRNTNIALPIPASFANLKNLKLIDLGENNLTGELPLVFAKVESLEDIRLNWNNLTGGIPDEYMQLKNLKNLNVYHNKMDGYISREMSESDWWKNLVVTYSQQDGYQLKFANPYESTDFSHDGEVKQIRKHSKGKGIKLVIIGDCFSDRLIADGTFDKQMKKTADAFFGVEPFTSFADYFDVYSVAAVSKNEDKNLDVAFSTTYTNGAYNYNVEKVKEYVLKIPYLNGSLANVTTLFVVNEKEENIYHTYMWDDGFSIAMCGTPDIEIIQHEGGGHGFGLLADEYGGGEEGPSAAVIQGIANSHKDGWFLNIDTESDPSKVLWKDFISNADYKVEGIGVYEGGYIYDKGVYRPTEHSVMKDNFGIFNAPSRWAIYQRIMKLAGESYTFDDFLKYDKKNLESIAKTRSYNENKSQFTPGKRPVIYNYPSSEIGMH